MYILYTIYVYPTFQTSHLQQCPTNMQWCAKYVNFFFYVVNIIYIIYTLFNIKLILNLTIIIYVYYGYISYMRQTDICINYSILRSLYAY